METRFEMPKLDADCGAFPAACGRLYKEGAPDDLATWFLLLTACCCSVVSLDVRSSFLRRFRTDRLPSAISAVSAVNLPSYGTETNGRMALTSSSRVGFLARLMGRNTPWLWSLARMSMRSWATA